MADNNFFGFNKFTECNSNIVSGLLCEGIPVNTPYIVGFKY